MRRIIPTSAFATTLLAATLASAGTTHQLRGEISRIDVPSRTLVVKEAAAPRKEVELTLASDAHVMHAGKAGAIGDLKAGEQVRVTYTDKGAAHQASRVEVISAKSAKS